MMINKRKKESHFNLLYNDLLGLLISEKYLDIPSIISCRFVSRRFYQFAKNTRCLFKGNDAFKYFLSTCIRLSYSSLILWLDTIIDGCIARTNMEYYLASAGNVSSMIDFEIHSAYIEKLIRGALMHDRVDMLCFLLNQNLPMYYSFDKKYFMNIWDSYKRNSEYPVLIGAAEYNVDFHLFKRILNSCQKKEKDEKALKIYRIILKASMKRTKSEKIFKLLEKTFYESYYIKKEKK